MWIKQINTHPYESACQQNRENRQKQKAATESDIGASSLGWVLVHIQSSFVAFNSSGGVPCSDAAAR